MGRFTTMDEDNKFRFVVTTFVVVVAVLAGIVWTWIK